MLRYILPLLLLPLTGCGSPPVAPVAAPAEVVVMKVIARDIPENATFVGSTVANRTVNLTARVTGMLRERPYAEGAVVAAGAPLFVLDPREFEASVQAAEAQVANAAAQLVKAEADFARIEPLVKTGVVAQTDLDAKRAAVLMAKAESLGAEAALAQARLNREYATITAPFAGIVGKANVDPGALVSPATGTLAVLDQVDPMAIEFTVAESALLKWRKELASGAVKAPLADQLTLTAQQIDGSTYPQEGHISFRDVRIQSQTGTALIRALFPNAQGRLRAGQFMRVSLSGATRVNAIVIPQAAVVQSPTGASVMVVDADNRVEARLVELGAWDGTGWIIASGLKSGETIIVEGVQKARHGALVKTTPAVPSASAAPAVQ